jgi:hypothetical protein
MLEQYFVKPATVDRIRGSWIGAEIEKYVGWLIDQGYGSKSIWRRVPIAFAFGEFARARGAITIADVPAHVDAFVAERVAVHDARTRSARPMAKEVRGPVEQFLAAVVAGFERTGRRQHPQPFAAVAPGFFDYLVEERGLRPASVLGYRHHLDRFEAYLERIGVGSIEELSPAILSAFVVERSSAGLARSTVRDGVGVLRVFTTAWRSRSARPATPPPSRFRPSSARRFSTTSGTAAPPRRIATCSSGRQLLAARLVRRRCPRWPVLTY